MGVFLGSALMLAAQQSHVVTGTVMLLCYALGLGVPFLLSALLMDKLRNALDAIKKHYAIIHYICGGFLCLVGLLMATGTLGRLLSLLGGSI